jgi:hypothetical protein
MNVAQFITGLLLIVLSAGLHFAGRSRNSNAGVAGSTNLIKVEDLG